jgi:FAD dependent oxidoreductase
MCIFVQMEMSATCLVAIKCSLYLSFVYSFEVSLWSIQILLIGDLCFYGRDAHWILQATLAVMFSRVNVCHRTSLLVCRSRTAVVEHHFKCQQYLAPISHYVQACRGLNSATTKPESFPTDARVVIAGGGVIGCSVAYHLAKTGWKDIVLLEQGR